MRGVEVVLRQVGGIYAPIFFRIAIKVARNAIYFRITIKSAHVIKSVIH
jgi:hypothetical protein